MGLKFETNEGETDRLVRSVLAGVLVLSGFFFPIQAMPQFLQWVSYLIPLRFYLVVIRALLLKGVGFEAIQREVIALAIFGTIIMGAAALRFRKRLD